MAEKRLTWDELQMFLAAARAGTLSASARALGISPATVLRRMRGLETKLNASLFVRSSRGYALTAAGTELLAHVQAMESEVLAAERQLGGRDLKLSGTIRVATLDDLVQAVLGPVMARFLQRHPSVGIDLVVDSEFTNLARRSADVAIRAGAQPTAADVIARSVCSIGVALYASRDYLRRHPGRPALEDLAGHRVVRADEARARLPMEKLLDRHAGGAAVAFRSNSMLARFAAVRDGLGVGFLPCFIGDSERELVRLGDVVPEASAVLWILTHPDLRRNARVRAFVDHVHTELLRMRNRFEGRA
jgi:DNA-binding transcriptional LysR family regulator